MLRRAFFGHFTLRKIGCRHGYSIDTGFRRSAPGDQSQAARGKQANIWLAYTKKEQQLGFLMRRGVKLLAGHVTGGVVSTLSCEPVSTRLPLPSQIGRKTPTAKDGCRGLLISCRRSTLRHPRSGNDVAVFSQAAATARCTGPTGMPTPRGHAHRHASGVASAAGPKDSPLASIGINGQVRQHKNQDVHGECHGQASRPQAR